MSSLPSPDPYSPEILIEVWSARTMGSHLDEMPRWLLSATRTGGIGPDQTMTAMMHYVESVPTFRKFRPALVWKFCLGKIPEAYQPNRPGETRSAALARMGLGEYLSVPKERLCARMIEAFKTDLARQLQDKPFVPPLPLGEAPDAESVAAQVTAEVQGTLTRARLLAAAVRSQKSG